MSKGENNRGKVVEILFENKELAEKLIGELLDQFKTTKEKHKNITQSSLK